MEHGLDTGYWRRRLAVVVVSLVATLAFASYAPDEAHAGLPANFTGWAEVNQTFACAAALPQCLDPHYPAYRWSGTAWQATEVRHDTDVYVYPYSGEWHWIWTQRTGWLAINTGYLMRE